MAPCLTAARVHYGKFLLFAKKFQVSQATFRIHGDVHQTRERRNGCGNSFRGWSRRNFSIDSPLFGFPSAVLALNVCAFKYLSRKRPQLVAPSKDIPSKRNKFFGTIQKLLTSAGVGLGRSRKTNMPNISSIPGARRRGLLSEASLERSIAWNVLAQICFELGISLFEAEENLKISLRQFGFKRLPVGVELELCLSQN